jgi:hypothetical protein
VKNVDLATQVLIDMHHELKTRPRRRKRFSSGEKAKKVKEGTAVGSKQY